MSHLRVAVLVDLPREKASGGHVKYWERLAQAAAQEDLPLDMTVYFSGRGEDEILSPHVWFRFLPPVFSTARLKFLPYVPAHTDLAPFHPRLAQELPAYDVIHTTDAFFAFARTAERIARWNNIPLTTSLHTDTPAYAELFTHQTLLSLMGRKFGGWLDKTFKISMREGASKKKRLANHLENCAAVLAMRPEDKKLAPAKTKPMRMGVDKNLFTPRPQSRADIERDYKISSGKFLVLFVGRVDAGKNMPLLLQSCVEARARGINLHLVVAGLGPLSDEVKQKLGIDATLAGLIDTKELARLYAAADCLAIASDIEIGGLIGVEALASGCPVLVSAQSGVAQLCGDTPAMQKVASNVPAWVDALVEFAQNKIEQQSMRAAALAFRQTQIAGWDEIVKKDFMPVWQNAGQRKS